MQAKFSYVLISLQMLITFRLWHVRRRSGQATYCPRCTPHSHVNDSVVKAIEKWFFQCTLVILRLFAAICKSFLFN